MKNQDFKKQDLLKAPIVEVFKSIQGEGKGLGKPSIFVRFFGCSLRCRFQGKTCDTPYAVSQEEDKAYLMTSLELAKVIMKFKLRNIVYTGGEPTLYQDFIVETISILNSKSEDYFHEVETNATIPLGILFEGHIDRFNMSVKLKSSNQLNEQFDKKRINYEAINTFPNYGYFKFVVSDENDIKEILKLHKKFPQFEVYLMPQGKTRKDIIKNSPAVIDICMKYGFTFSPREHIIIYDSKRGV